MPDDYTYELPNEPFDTEKLSGRGRPAEILKAMFEGKSIKPQDKRAYDLTYKDHLQRTVAGGYPGGAEGYIANAKAARAKVSDRTPDVVVDESGFSRATKPGILPRLDDWTLNRENFIFQGRGKDLGLSQRGGKTMGIAWPNAYTGSGGRTRSVIAMPGGPDQSGFAEEMTHGAQPYANPRARVGEHYGSIPIEAGAKWTNLKQDYVTENWPDENMRKHGLPDPATGKPRAANTRQYGPEDSKKILDKALANPENINDSGLKRYLSTPEGQKDVRENYDYWIQFLNETAQATPGQQPGMFTGQERYA